MTAPGSRPDTLGVRVCVRALAGACGWMMVVWAGPDVSAAANPRTEQAQVLFEQGRAEVARGTIDGRRAGMQRLLRARQLDPSRADIQLELARLEQQVGFLQLARHDFEAVAERNPDDPEARRGLAMLWRRDYLKYLEPASLDLAIIQLTEVVRLLPEDTDAWLNLVPLLVEKGNLKAALNAAERARESAPSRSDVALAVAHTSYRLGQVG